MLRALMASRLAVVDVQATPPDCPIAVAAGDHFAATERCFDLGCCFGRRHGFRLSCQSYRCRMTHLYTCYRA